MCMSVACGLRGCWFKPQAGLQDMSVDGSGVSGRLSDVEGVTGGGVNTQGQSRRLKGLWS